MPLWYLSHQLVFPHPLDADVDGILAVGGDLTIDRLLLAYRFGIFPWYDEDSPILWWFPDPRCVLDTDQIHVSRSMRALINRGRFRISADESFRAVVEQCRTIPRKGQDGTWILPEMVDAYTELHRRGYAHSVEVWEGDKLVGGIYGVALGAVFFGESMFSRVANGSKVALIALGRLLRSKGFHLIDCQQETEHVRSMGATMITAEAFHALLQENRKLPENTGKWNYDQSLLHL